MNRILLFKSKINRLPKEIQRLIYIFAIKKFWRNFIPLTAKIPSWYIRKNKVEKIIYESKLKNIHFLHLPFNTIDNYKEWIMGCQCDYCKKIEYKYTYKLYRKQYHNNLFFKTIMPRSSASYYNDTYYIDGSGDITFSYDPLCGSIYENYDSYLLRQGVD